MAAPNSAPVVVRSGPGIGRAAASLFAWKGYSDVALIARLAKSLRLEWITVEELPVPGSQLRIQPIPQHFAQFSVKAAQRNLMRSLEMA
ncbi:hypothetical protein DL767_004819 [Monosporascus sp. MG133]|nr:hypothetical protein DL767_004819 [Monosporascus sp. MG133]